MGFFGRKQNTNPTPAANPAKGPGAPVRPGKPSDRTVPHSRQGEHASEAPRGIDSNFCYGDDKD